jgi:hypothetical protein
LENEYFQNIANFGLMEYYQLKGLEESFYIGYNKSRQMYKIEGKCRGELRI